MTVGPFGKFRRDLAASLRGSVAGLGGMREEQKARKRADTPPGLIAAFSNAAHRGNQTLRVFEDRVELSTQNVLSADSERVRYGQIAGVSRTSGLSGYSTVVIETTGGARLVVKGLPNAKAADALEIIGSRTHPSAGPAGNQPPPDVQFV